MERVDASRCKDGAGDGNRTRDVQLGKLAFYQLNYSRTYLTVILRQIEGWCPDQSWQSRRFYILALPLTPLLSSSKQLYLLDLTKRPG